MTTESKIPALWPFLLVDGLFLGLAFLLFQQAARPMSWWEAGAVILCAAIGAGAFITPFLRRADNTQTLLQAQQLADATGKIQKLEELAAQIAGSTAHWQAVQDASAKTVQTATQLSRNMTEEARAFTEFLQKANDAERAHLRLEAEKLRRAETEWLQIVIRILDQVHALFMAAVQSGQPALTSQIVQFQTVCREIPRRVGLVALTAPSGEPFDSKRHQLLPDAAGPAENALILETLAPGYSYQGQLVRRVLVRLQEAVPAPPSA